MDQSLIDRINELSRLSRIRELTQEEMSEREKLRGLYISEYRRSLHDTLENTYIKRPDGTVEKLKRKESK